MCACGGAAPAAAPAARQAAEAAERSREGSLPGFQPGFFPGYAKGAAAEWDAVARELEQLARSSGMSMGNMELYRGRGQR